MSLKLFFQFSTAICGVIAVVCGLLPSPNRILLVIVFASISGIFGVAIPYLVVGIPELDYSITSSSSNYAEGLQIDGVVWEKDFREYFLWNRPQYEDVPSYAVL